MKNNNDNIEKLLTKLNVEFEPEIVPVLIEDYSQERQCYNNVEQKIKNDGGKIHYGWIIHQTNLLCEAEHHAVWENDNMELIDITPNQNGDNEILFVSANNYIYNGKDVDNVRVNATNNSVVDDFILVCETIGKLYAFGNRINKTEIKIPDEAIIRMINEYLEIKEIYLYFINNKSNERSLCFCGGAKSYQNCCKSLVQQTVIKDLKMATEIIAKL